MLKFPVVGIGASAGGLAPMLKFFELMPAGSGMAFVVVVHLSPEHASSLPQLLQAVTTMRVVSADESIGIEANTVYVIPPNKMLTMNDSYLQVTNLDRPRGRQVAIDLFFRSLAIVHRERAFAVVLSGSGTDGAVGITRIKEEGGVSIVQTPADAEFDGMPRAAIGTGNIDWVLPLEDIPSKLVELWKNAQAIELPGPREDGMPAVPPASPQAAKLAEDALRDILQIVKARTGHDFRNYKRGTVLRRLERRLQVHGLPNLPAYRAFLQAQPEEAQALLKDLLIGVTNFFRDPEAFDSLAREAVARLFEESDKRQNGVRAWVAGCATGEEAYSVAILLCEQAAQLEQSQKIHVFATDIDESAIAQARLGTYPGSIETDVTPMRLRRFFEREGDHYRIRKDVREKVMFAVHNLLHDPPFSKLDLICCRNLLIYFDRDVHAEVFEMFHFALRPGGYLFLGSSESADVASHYFSVVDKKQRIFRANVVPRTTRYMPSLPLGKSLGLVTNDGPSGRGAGARPRLAGADLVRRGEPATPEDHDALLAQLEDELGRTKDQLQNRIEQSDTSTEELKASNEELQAINEELRSTTEELETSKEELQSINEELITVNHELKSKVEETSKINDDLQNLIASTDIATVFVDRTMSIKRYTPHATHLFNLIPTDVGRSLLDITHKLNYDRLADDAAEAFQSLRVIEREVSTQTGRWYLARVLPYRTVEDRIDGAVLTFVDITSRRKAEETMRLIAESTKDYAIVTFGLDGRIGTWNHGAETVFGYAEHEAIGQSIAVLFVPEDRQSGQVEAELRRAREEGRAEDDRWHLRKDGVRIFCSGITTPLLEEGRLVGYAKIARDLTGSKRLENERERRLREEAAKRAEAQAAIELKDEFLAVMSHELKNPLNLIQLNADLLVRLPEARGMPAVQRAATIIRRTVMSQAQIIDDLLDLSRINTGKLRLNRTGVDWQASVAAIVSAIREEAESKGVSVSTSFDDKPLIVDADQVRVEQIVWNLLSNAVKFTPSQGAVNVRLVRDGNFGRLDVRDTGRGIEPETLPHVFEMYKQAESGGVRLQGGLGIGLAVVKHLVVLHGGRVEAESEGRDRGALLSVWLPLAGAEVTVPGELDTAPRAWLANRRVLIVDDDQQSIETLRHLLETEGMEVVEASSAEQALEQVAKGRFDVVLTDIAMPHMDGHELLQALRRDEHSADVPVLALTGLGRPEDVKRAIAAGFRAHLTKPVSMNRLLATLDAVLGGDVAS